MVDVSFDFNSCWLNVLTLKPNSFILGVGILLMSPSIFVICVGLSSVYAPVLSFKTTDSVTGSIANILPLCTVP